MVEQRPFKALVVGSSPTQPNFYPVLRSITIVVVDDRSGVRFLIAEFLAKRGAVVFAAKNAFEGYD